MAAPIGLDGLVFGTEDAAATYQALRRNQVPIDPPRQFSRPVVLSAEVGAVAGTETGAAIGGGTGSQSVGGARDAVFRTTRLPRDHTPAGRLYFCQHLTRDLIWRDEWRHHANGAVGVARAVIAAEDPGVLGGLFARMFGAAAVRPTDDG